MSTEIPEGYNIYTFNQYHGANPPEMSETGLPPFLSTAALPTQSPPAEYDAPGIMGDNLPYSPTFVEMAARSPGSSHVVLGQPADPRLWKTLTNDALDGNITIEPAPAPTSSVVTGGSTTPTKPVPVAATIKNK